jgi:hypothetical protein
MQPLNASRPRYIAMLLFLAIILLVAAALHLHGIVQELPYHLNPDEPHVWQYVTHLTTTGRLLNHYPPARIVTLAVWFRLIDWVTPGAPSQTAEYLTGRIATVWLILLLLALTYQAGRSLINRAAGIGAMLFLMVQPDIVLYAKQLRVDSFAWMFGMLTIVLTILAVRTPRRWLIVPAFVTGGLAVLGKYTMLPVLIVPGLALVAAIPRRTSIRLLLALAAVTVVVAGFAIMMDPPAPLAAFLMRFHARQLYERESFFQFVSLGRAWSELQSELGILNIGMVALGLPFAALVWPRFRLTSRQWLLIGMIAAALVITFFLLGLFRTNRAKDRFLILLGFAVLWGGWLGMMLRGRLAWTVAAAGLLLAPWLVQGWQHGSQLGLPDTRVMTVDWFLDNTPSGTRIALEKDVSEFLAYGGYQGTKVFFTEEITSVYDRSLEDFARSGVEYLVADYRNINRGGFFERGRDNTEFLSNVETELTLLEPWTKGWQGPERYIFRIPPLQEVPMHVFLGDAIIFKGYDLSSNRVMPGETLDLVLYWSALRETDANYVVFTHLYGEDGALVAQMDGLPGDPAHRTYDWAPGYFDWDPWPLTIPADISPGTYNLAVGMYDSDTLIRLGVTDANGTPAGDTIPLGTIDVLDGPDN